MITVNIISTNARKTVVTEITSTPKDVIEEAGFNGFDGQFSIHGIHHQPLDLGTPFDELEDVAITDGESFNLSIINKKEGA